jgi:hypothetical protein
MFAPYPPSCWPSSEAQSGSAASSPKSSNIGRLNLLVRGREYRGEFLGNKKKQKQPSAVVHSFW